MDIEGFEKFVMGRGLTESKTDEHMKNLGLILKISGAGPLTIAHMEQTVRLGETKKIEPKAIDSLKRTCMMVMEYQRSLEKKDVPKISVEHDKTTDGKYPYGFYSRLYFKIPFFALVLMVIIGFVLKYVPIDPSSFVGKAKAKLDDLTYSMPVIGGLSKVVKDAYETAKKDVYHNDLLNAEIHLKKAIRFKPDFTEAWYNLGATQTNYAIELAKENKDREALNKFREAVASKKRSKFLMDQKIWYVYKDQEQDLVRHDVKEALEYADEAIANDGTLLLLLKSWPQ